MDGNLVPGAKFKAKKSRRGVNISGPDAQHRFVRQLACEDAAEGADSVTADADGLPQVGRMRDLGLPEILTPAVSGTRPHPPSSLPYDLTPCRPLHVFPLEALADHVLFY